MRALIVSAMLAFVPAARAATPAHTNSNAAGQQPAAAGKAGAQPAAWLQHNLIVSLHDLPRTYSCNDLWYKFRDVLLEIGARADYKVLPYDCGSRSPQVQLNFWLPQPLSPAQKQYADLNATAKTVELKPGEPSTLKASDCDLVRQMNRSFFPAIPLEVVGSQLQCSASPKKKPRFEVSVAALTPPAQGGANPALAAQGPATSSQPSGH